MVSESGGAADGPLRIAVLGAGVIGSVYAARLADAGHRVTLVARGRRLKRLRANGLWVRTSRGIVTADVTLTDLGEGIPEVDMLIIAVRTTQLPSLLDPIASSSAPIVAFLQHLGPYSEDVTTKVGKDRGVIAFPGIGGFMTDDGVVEYVEIDAQPTTIDATVPNARPVASAIALTGMRTATEQDMAAWLATHEVFVACLGAGILACGGDSVALARHRPTLRQTIQGVYEGFSALETGGMIVTPRALRMLFVRMPRWFAAAYWRRALKGPIGTVALAPHIRASKDDEFPLLCSTVLNTIPTDAHVPTLRKLLAPYRRSPHSEQ